MRSLSTELIAVLVTYSSFFISSASGEKVFGLGPARTGTLSLRKALNHLGFGPTYHMMELLFEETGISTGDDMGKWQQAGVGIDVQKNLAEILEPWRSGCDLPVMSFPDELLEIYPDAKFVLTVRPAEKWHASISNTVCHMRLNWYSPVIRQIPFHPFARFKTQYKMLNAVTENIYSGNDFSFLCDPANRDTTLKWYNDWNIRIQKTIPKDQLLVFRTGEHGYKELATFLNVPVPDEPYPSSNSSAEFGKAKIVFSLAAVFMIFVSALSIAMLSFCVHCLLSKITGSQADKKIKTL